MDIRLWDNKLKKDLFLYRGDSLYKYDTTEFRDTLTAKISSDSAKTVVAKDNKRKKNMHVSSYNLGTIIAMFPDTDYNKVVNKSSTDIYRMLMRNGLQVFFSQRYQGDQFLKWVFNYF